MDDSKLPPRVAVCLAAYNGIRWLDDQLDSILSQVGVSVTVFISVDRSIDGTEALIDGRKANEPRLVVLPHGERFGSAAQNFFRLLREVDFTNFDYVSFSDQDDIWLVDKLRQAIAIGALTGADAVSSNVVAFWQDGREKLIRKNQPMGRWNHLFEAAGPGCTYLLKAPLAESFGTMLRNNIEMARRVELHDWMVFAWATEHGYRWYIDEYARVRYRQHSENVMGANTGIYSALSRWRKLCNGWYRSQVLLVAHLAGASTALPVHRLRRFLWLDRVVLALSVREFRRRWFDRLTLAAAFILMQLNKKC